ncbi:MAG: GNAT family N-acetyltransferase [Oscillospiraceae bacterium]|jgi:RimJ/RimL family protein N-acetyltransferase|nr:GNAT family N-acetyltransferase [Oscillospiraceae bacterium]
MKTIETERLILRKFTPDDFAAVHSLFYMVWEPNTEEQTRAFINMAISKANETPCTNYQYAAVHKETGNLIGACNLALSGDEAETGWILHRDLWEQGFGAEMGKTMLQLGFDELSLCRVVARCDAENYGYYRAMEKIGMRREGLFVEGRRAHKLSDKQYGDELSYAICKDEWDTGKEIAYYNALPVVFNDFIDVPVLSDNVIHLVCIAKKPAVPEKKYVPSYDFAICKGSEKIGEINLRIGYVGYGPDSSSLYYGGQIGYNVNEEYRGNGYAGRACRLLHPVVKAHGMTKLLITNNVTNTASRRVCEKLGARFLRLVRLPEWIDLYKEGQRFSNIFEWSME